MKNTKTLFVAAIAALVPLAMTACSTPPTEASGALAEAASLARTPMPKPQGTVSATFPCEGVPFNRGGHLMTGAITIHPVFYGTAWQPGYQATILSFLTTMSQTSYWQVVEEYTDKATGGHPGAATIAPVANVGDYMFGNSLTDDNIVQIARIAADTSSSPPGSQDIFMVFTADDVDQHGGQGALCETYLGWHSQGNFLWTSSNDAHEAYVTTPIAFIGSDQFCIANPAISPVTCSEDDAGPGPSAWNETANGSGPPNSEVIDIGISAALHEAAETATDPIVGTGVYPEIGDICAWEPGPLTLTGSPFSYVNSDLGGGEPYGSRQWGYAGNNLGEYFYLVQTLWDINQNGCAYGPASLDGIRRIGR